MGALIFELSLPPSQEINKINKICLFFDYLTIVLTFCNLFIFYIVEIEFYIFGGSFFCCVERNSFILL